jgi:radical SAM protein with 4Fe4S-binding SPASM domain
MTDLIPNLVNLSIFTTNRCTLSCYYCNRNVRGDTPGAENKYLERSEFHFRDLKKLLDKYPSIRNVSFVGIGEPFLCADLLPMADYARKNGKRTSVITNGTLLHRYHRQIASHFHFISISLHGLNADELENIAKAGEKVFRQWLENIRFLVTEEKKANADLIIHASVVLLKENLDRVRRAAFFCRDNQIPVLDIQNYIPNSLLDVNQCLYDDDVEPIRFLEELRSQLEGSVKINIPIRIKRDVREMAWACPIIFNTLRVDGNGNISGCTVAMVPKPENGNIRIDNDVWNNSYYREMRRHFTGKTNLPECCRYCRNAQ